MRFNTVLKNLNKTMEVTFRNTNARGIISRTDKRGKWYYTDDNRKHTTLREAIEHRNSILVA